MSSKGQEHNSFLMISKGVVSTILVTLICILLFALVVKISTLSSQVIKWVNQFLKIFALFVGIFFTIKGKIGFLKGAIVGLVSTLITFLLFKLISGHSASFLSILLECVFCSIIGAIFGVLAVNRKNNA